MMRYVLITYDAEFTLTLGTQYFSERCCLLRVPENLMRNTNCALRKIITSHITSRITSRNRRRHCCLALVFRIVMRGRTSCDVIYPHSEPIYIL